MNKKKPRAKARGKGFVRRRDEHAPIHRPLSLREYFRFLVDLAHVIVWVVDLFR